MDGEAATGGLAVSQIQGGSRKKLRLTSGTLGDECDATFGDLEWRVGDPAVVDVGVDGSRHRSFAAI
jgi:hypothetical protein